MSKGNSTKKKKFLADFNEVEEAVRRRIGESLGSRSRSDLARLTGESTANVSRYLTDKKISLRFFWAVCKALQVNPQWLLSGKGPMNSGEIDWSLISYEKLQTEAARQRVSLEKNLAKLVAAIKPGDTMTLSEFMQRGVEAGIVLDHRTEEGDCQVIKYHEVAEEELEEGVDWIKTYVPVVDCIAAGLGRETEQANAFPPGWAESFVQYSGAPEGAFAVRVSGNSMAPDFQDGDLVVVDPAQHAKNGDVAVVIYNCPDIGVRLARLKRIRKRGKTITLESINPHHHPVKLPAKAVIVAYKVHDHLQK